MITSRYSLGTTSDAAPARFWLFSRSVKSCSSASAFSVGKAANAWCTGPYRVLKTSMK